MEIGDTYKIRVNVEKTINHFKDSFCIAECKTQNEKMLQKSFLCAFYLNIVGNIRNFMKKYIIQPVNGFLFTGNSL